LALGTTPFAGIGEGGTRVAWPRLFEALFTVAAIAALLPLFFILARDVEGRGGRFAEDAMSLGALPSHVLPALCATHGNLADAVLRERLCTGVARRSPTAEPDRMPFALADANARARRAFAEPFLREQSRLAQLRLQPREAPDDASRIANRIDAIETRLREFAHRYAIDPGIAPSPASLVCAFDLVAAVTAARSHDADGAAGGNALLLLAAALDGDARGVELAARVPLPDVSKAVRRTCAGWRLADALSGAASVMGDARRASLEGAKNASTRALLQSAGWQWAGAMLIGLALLDVSRRRGVALAGVALACVVWAIAAWIARVPWPLAAERAFVPGRQSLSPDALPAPFVVALLACGGVAAIVGFALRRRMRSTPQTIASRVGYPGFVVATGLGWLLLLDLSANGNPGNRYLALYHQGHLWLAMLVLTLVAFVRQPLGRALAWVLSMVDGLVGAVGRRLGGFGGTLVAVALTAAVAVAFGALLANLRQVTSELGRVWLMLGAAWFFFLRGAPFAERLARSGTSWMSLVRYIAPLAFVVCVLIGAMILTRDMGPLLIAGYAGGAFVAASAAMWLHERYGVTHIAYATGVGVFIGWIVLVTVALFRLGAVDDVTAARLDNLVAPLASANDQLALVTWFQQVSPHTGFGLGSVPWCGYSAAVGCAGLPAQIQSDYTFTAIVGAFGAPAAWAATLGCALWLHRLIRHHGRVTSGEPRFVAATGRMGSDEQAFLSWLAVTWVVLTLCQLAVTVAGNVAVIPLTGVTFPFVSFGMTSLLVNAALLALCLNVNLPRGAPR